MSASTERLRAAIAENLRYARGSRGFSLRDLAEQAGVSKALLSQLERGVANPTIEVLSAVATALDLDFTDLIRTPLYEPQVLRAAAGEGARTLFSSPDRRRFEVYETTLAAGEPRDSAPHGRGSEEFAYVLAGEVVLESGQWTVRLGPGDGARFSGEAEHSYTAGGGTARLLTLLSMPSD
ncbi:helix-turn-helix domain-containing protein [Actinomadura parmotrematis]|uniref:XRE family transcriptional regulator n=1 Tax=Actinomadura parmotrematis TaxID=2864039 RepID=A0ABS7FUP4_9ACTN|nr:XRE family transcriptional regulator [Actinomadura parmotrematis]MBW8484131.1 XRE family transcriptional regulator [Actinomadura parmotrematis]